MALQTSGSISLNQIHVEASNSGYASGNVVSLNDTDVRGLTAGAGKTIDNTAGSAIDFSVFMVHLILFKILISKQSQQALSSLPMELELTLTKPILITMVGQHQP